VLPQVAEALPDPDVPWPRERADTTQPPEGGFEPGAQTRRAIFGHVPTGGLLLGVMHELRHVALYCLRAAGRGGREPPARVHGHVGGLRDRVHRTILGRLDDDGPLAADPGDAGRAVCVIMASTRLARLATTPRAASHRLLAAVRRWALTASGVLAVLGCTRALPLARHRVGQGHRASPPTPASTGPQRAVQRSGHAT